MRGRAAPPHPKIYRVPPPPPGDKYSGTYAIQLHQFNTRTDCVGVLLALLGNPNQGSSIGKQGSKFEDRESIWVYVCVFLIHFFQN